MKTDDTSCELYVSMRSWTVLLVAFLKHFNRYWLQHNLIFVWHGMAVAIFFVMGRGGGGQGKRESVHKHLG